MARKTHRKPPVWLIALTVCYLAFLAVLTLLNRFGMDLWWFSALNLYIPQLLWAVPGIILAVLVGKVSWKWAGLPLFGITWVLTVLMGYCWPFNPASEATVGLPIRVMTWNVKYYGHNQVAHLALKYAVETNDPTVLFLQDTGEALKGPLGEYLKGWNVRSSGEFLIASRLPLGEIVERKTASPRVCCVRCDVKIGPTPVTLYNVHLVTPRDGLNALVGVRKRPWYLPQAALEMEQNMAQRLTEVRTLQEYLRQEKGPVLAAGDFNSPDASLVGAALRAADLHDAFAEAGCGYGYTYGHFLLRHRVPALNFSWMRIDHIMMSPQLRARRCWTGTGKASDHRPVIADLVLSRN